MPKIGGCWTLIMGATTGIGFDVAKLLASKGENLVLACYDEVRLCKMARELCEVSDIIIMPVDLSRSESSTLIFQECERLGLKIKKLYNFASENN
jgi:short-subunit dehydrogenase